MSAISMKPVLFILAIAVSVFATLQGAYAQSAGAHIGTETVAYTSNFTQFNGTSFEAKISSNSSLVVQTVLVETNSSSTPSVAVNEWRVYGQSGEPFVHKSTAAPLPAGSDGEVRAIAGVDALPLGTPEGGSIGAVFEVSGLQQGDQVKVMFVYMANAGSAVSSEIVQAVQFPFYVTENSQEMAGNASSIRVDDSFVNPELHCETCTKVESLGPAGIAYTINATDLTGAMSFVFFAMGTSGGESVTFNVAGKEQSGPTTYANTTTATLENDWKRYEVDLAGADLQGITHLFGFEVSGAQTFYVKGASYN